MMKSLKELDIKGDKMQVNTRNIYQVRIKRNKMLRSYSDLIQTVKADLNGEIFDPKKHKDPNQELNNLS